MGTQKPNKKEKCDYSGVCVKHTVRHAMDVNNQSILSYDIFKRKMYRNYFKKNVTTIISDY